MSSVDYIVGGPDILPQPLGVYSDEAVDFLSDLSAALMKDPDSRMYPDVISAAFWCRRANISKLKQQYRDAGYRLGRGLAFHIAPSNIPVNFIFSYFFGLLAGNANIVRLPSRRFAQAGLICRTLKDVLERHPQIKARTAIVSYPAEDELSRAFSAMADLRVIWGGDRTIERMRGYPTKPKCVDLVFADRYSVCLLNAEAVLQAGEGDMARLAERFYNDTYLMDQNACSSPQMILWTNGSRRAREKFWACVAGYAQKKYRLADMLAMDKYVQACADAIRYDEVRGIVRQNGGLLYRAELTELNREHDLRGKGGYFYEADLGSLDELFAVVDEKYQTLTYFGFDPRRLRDMVVQGRLRGIDRIVPVGSAMDIGVVWDGYDIVTMLSRLVYAD